MSSAPAPSEMAKMAARSSPMSVPRRSSATTMMVAPSVSSTTFQNATLRTLARNWWSSGLISMKSRLPFQTSVMNSFTLGASVSPTPP
jgi:hypothetical protein